MVLERTVLYVGLIPAIVFCGIIGNILTLIVFCKVKDSGTASLYLKNLAVADTISLTIRCVCMVFIWTQIFWPTHYLTWKLNSTSFNQLAKFSDRISKYIIVSFVCEKVIAVAKPLDLKMICTPMRTTVVLVVIYVVMIATSAPMTVDVFMHSYGSTTNITGVPTMQKEIKHYLHERLFKSKVKTLFCYLISITVLFCTIYFYYSDHGITHAEKQGSCPLRCAWAARGNFAMQTGLPTTFNL